MNFKRYNESDNSWTDSHYIMGTDTDTLSQLPTTIYPNDTSVTVGIKGNTTQSGTPTPSNPVDVNGTGERTAQLFEDKIANCSIDANGYLISNSSFDMYIAKIEQGVTYTASASITGGFFTSKPVIGSRSYNGQRMAFAAQTFTAPITGYVTFRVNSGATMPMLNVGETSLPVEPYGYKIPILINGNTTNIYIGENPLRKSLDGTAYDTLDADGTLTQRVDSDGSVLATPVVTQITMPTFTVTAGENSFDVDTTVAPSEVTAGFSGWHPVSGVHERENGQWD